LIYTERRDQSRELVKEIDSHMLSLVLDIMLDKHDFDNIFKKLKNESRQRGKDQSSTRMIVVKWYKEIFESFDTDLIDSNRDIYVTEIDNINFEYHELAQLQIDLVCMLSRKNEDYFREIMEKLIQRFHN
jgi:hypothetical protein